jgi:hypothetical protein
VVLGALGRLVPQARRHTLIGILGHSSGGAAAGEAMLDHRQLRAGVNLDGFIPGGAFLRSGRLLTDGLDRPFGLMLSLDLVPQEGREIELFVSNMRAPHPARSLDIHHYGFSDFVVFNPQAQRADPALGTALEDSFSTGTRDSLAAGQRALMQQRAFLVGFSTVTWRAHGPAAPAPVVSSNAVVPIVARGAGPYSRRATAVPTR